MDDEQRRRIVIFAGGGGALLAGLLIAYAVSHRAPEPSSKTPPANRTGLVVEMGHEEEKLDPARPLRCFVGGTFVGELTLAECAKKNGVATGGLDVGLDAAGNLTAADTAGTLLTPLPPDAQTTPAATPAPAQPVPAPAQVAACWRYAGGQWARGADATLNACVQTLFAGRCQTAGGADYGRWGEQTLRLSIGKVEISADNRTFRTLAEQSATCVIAPVQ